MPPPIDLQDEGDSGDNACCSQAVPGRVRVGEPGQGRAVVQGEGGRSSPADGSMQHPPQHHGGRGGRQQGTAHLGKVRVWVCECVSV